MLHIVTGAPCSGKSTYVAENRNDDDVVIDFDALEHALGSTQSHGAPDNIRDVAFSARDAATDRIIQRDYEAWIIHTTMTPDQRTRYEDAGAEFIELDTDRETCLARCEQDGRPDGTAERIEAYFERNEKRGTMLTKQFDLQVKEAGEQDGEHYIIAYASTFHKDPDSYGDIVAPGAFANTLEKWRESGKPIPLLFGHRMDDPMYNIGYVAEAEEDEIGLKVKGIFDTTTERGAYTAKLAAEGRLTKLSFAYDVLDAAVVTLEDGTKANELRELEIYEVSLVVVPANSHAEVIDAKAGRRNSAADEDTLHNIIDGLSAAIESINGLLGMAPDGNDGQEMEAEEQTEAKAEAEEPTEAKADTTALIASIDSFINRMERSQ